jgi:hypothetical protein
LRRKDKQRMRELYHTAINFTVLIPFYIIGRHEQ